MPLPPATYLEGVLYDVYETQPYGRGFTKVLNYGGTTLTKGKALHLNTNGVELADASLGLECMGFAWEDIDPLQTGWMLHDSDLYLPDWFLFTNPSTQYLTQGVKYYLHDAGNITDVLPVSGFLQEVGTAHTIQTLSVEFQGVGLGGGITALIAQMAALQAQVDAIEADYMEKSVYDTDDNDIVDNSERLEEVRDILTIITQGQVAFILSKAAFQPNLANLKLNGIEQIYGIDYTIVGANLTWIGSVQLDTTDHLEIIYR